ncbi:bacteriophage protein [Lentibacillus populi]|uniref:Bacteriophage protein n=1 Tax=Lentibacillus populi TaxID=1827502 RepID=A0A9W5X7X6_9BACI|nr:hypothetical protein [Lentibacillus populi]MBT2215856.1 hypothetical protein [Virgibacillus dakarensis]MBT2215928.1 hypothetical protein [Virgibacillus dakarensis]GGB63657.1 bacteriophage protein [Lentibacillus populi]
MDNKKDIGALIELSDWSNPDFGRYGNIDELSDMILNKRIKHIDKDKIELENGLVLTIECSEADCCAGGGGTFEFAEYGIPIDALITDFVIGKPIEVPDSDTIINRNTITLFHNQNPIVLANAETDAGNGGYYYSVTSLVVGEIHFPFVKA